MSSVLVRPYVCVENGGENGGEKTFVAVRAADIRRHDLFHAVAKSGRMDGNDVYVEEANWLNGIRENLHSRGIRILFDAPAVVNTRDFMGATVDYDPAEIEFPIVLGAPALGGEVVDVVTPADEELGHLAVSAESDIIVVRKPGNVSYVTARHLPVAERDYAKGIRPEAESAEPSTPRPF